MNVFIFSRWEVGLGSDHYNGTPSPSEVLVVCSLPCSIMECCTFFLSISIPVYVCQSVDCFVCQCTSELAIMTGHKRMMVEETVKEHKADELSAMFNMLMDKKKKQRGK